MNREQNDIRAYVPGKQVTLAHLIAHPDAELCMKIGLETTEAVGILTLTPGESAILAGDVAVKAASVHLAFLDRFSGTLIVYGSVGDVEQALHAVTRMLTEELQFIGCRITRH